MLFNDYFDLAGNSYELEKLDLVKIGYGQFAKVYQSSISGLVFIFVNNDVTKRVLCSFAGKENFPNMARLGTLYDYNDREIEVYVSEWYKTLDLLDDPPGFIEYYETYCKKIFNQSSAIGDYSIKLINFLSKYMDSKLYKAILAYYSELIRVYGDNNFCIEFKRENLAVDDNGNIILLDIAFPY